MNTNKSLSRSRRSYESNLWLWSLHNVWHHLWCSGNVYCFKCRYPDFWMCHYDLQVFQQEVTSRRDMIKSLQNSPGLDAVIRSQLMELNNVWDHIQEMADVRDAKLAEALILVSMWFMKIPLAFRPSRLVNWYKNLRVCARSPIVFAAVKRSVEEIVFIPWHLLPLLNRSG